MRKRMLLLTVVFMFILAIPAYAAEQRNITVKPTLSFDGTEATCKVQILADRSNDSISATIKLWQGSTCLKTWTEQGTGILFFEDTVIVAKGKTYKLTADAVIAGRPVSTVSVEKKCS